MTASDFAARLRRRERLIGYWSVLDSPVSTEWLAHVGYDYLAQDMQHGLIGDSGMVAGLTAIDAAHGPVGLIRVEANNPTPIGRALDAGAAGIIVPLVNTADEAADADTVVLAMIETPQGLANVDSICATPGLAGVYVGPSDLRLAVGGAHPQDPAVDDEFQAALVRVRDAAAAAGVAAGIHTPDGATAARRLGEGFTFASIASDLTHLKQTAAAHLKAATGG